ncbi:MAG: hypothetical protein GF311_02555 [Candidatus Lokiarchaeota archaeon]|nr:hypothetical protein [Candidatus Lokiarchaeota archaeon]
MNNNLILKWLLIVGGLVEIIIGILFLFIPYALSSIGLPQIPFFSQMAGSFLLGFGILLLYSSKRVEIFRIVPLVNILIRFIMIGFSLLSIPSYPEFVVILIPAILYDLVWSILFLYLLDKENLLFPNAKNE